MQVPVPEQPPPLQPVKVELAAGVAVKVTAVPLANGAEHVAPQAMPAGLLVTVPAPAPALVSVRVKDCTANVAVTEVAAFTVTMQVPVPEQPPPLQPEKVEPAVGVAVKVTAVPVANGAEHVAPQAMPAGLLFTVPAPAPALVSVRVKDCTANVAVTEVAAFSVTMQVPVPEQPPPLQPEKVEPAVGVAVKVTAVPLGNGAEPAAPQAMPAGLLATVPAPAPALVSVRVKDCAANVAVTEVAAFRVTMQVPVPEQPPPLQPVKVELASGVAVKVTAVPLANGAAHVAPQAMPAGLLATVPAPTPALVSVRVKDCTANVAVTEVAAFRVTMQVPEPEQPPPLQPVKVELASGVAVSVTAVPPANEAEQAAPQEIPGGALLTVPLPVPVLVTLRAKDCWTKPAVTEAAALMVTMQVPVPEQPPLQLEEVDPAVGVAVKVTAVPLANGAEHVAPQATPAGLLVTVPAPAPALVTVSVKV